MQTENRNMQTDCSTIIVWKLLVKDNNIFNVHDDACSLYIYESIKKEKCKSIFDKINGELRGIINERF